MIFFDYSVIHQGLGFAISSAGIIFMLFMFQKNLHSIKEPEIKKNRILGSLKFVLCWFIAVLIIAISVVSSFDDTYNIYLIHVKIILFTIIVFIFIPKYYISQDDKLKLYVSVYHRIPAPVLPWQLPKDFDQNSVKLTCVKYKIE